MQSVEAIALAANHNRFELAHGLGPGGRLCSDYFEVNGWLFRLEVYPAGVTVKVSDYLSVYLTTPSPGASHLLYEIAVVDQVKLPHENRCRFPAPYVFSMIFRPLNIRTAAIQSFLGFPPCFYCCFLQSLVGDVPSSAPEVQTGKHRHLKISSGRKYSTAPVADGIVAAVPKFVKTQLLIENQRRYLRDDTLLLR